MTKKMSAMGVGGKIAVILLVFAAAAYGVSEAYRPAFEITDRYNNLLIAGITMAVVGFALNLVAAFGMLRARRSDRLATGGLYAVFRHPMYTFQILVTVPGLLLLFNSWLVLAAVIPTFIAFKLFSREEDRYLAGAYGAQYDAYKQKVRISFL